MLKRSYQGRTYKMGVLLPMLLGVIALPPVLLSLFKDQLTPARICYGGGASLVAFFLVVAGGQSAAIFTASPDGFGGRYLTPGVRSPRAEHPRGGRA